MRYSRSPVVVLVLALAACGGEDEMSDEAPPPAETPQTPTAQLPSGPDIWIAPLSTESGTLTVGEARNVTNRDGYDNQPSFFADGSVLFTRQDGERTDIWRWDPATDEVTPVTRTDPESEYSPTPLPGGGGFSAVRVEADSTQRLWRFAMDGSGAEVILPDVAPVGYHAWIGGDTLALFVLGDPATLRIAAASTGEAETVESDIGRSLQPVPGRSAFSYTKNVEGGTEIRIFDLSDGSDELAAMGLDGGDFHAWTPGGVLLQASGGRLMRWDEGMGHWMLVTSLDDRGVTLSRIAVSPDGEWIALVAEPAPPAE